MNQPKNILKLNEGRVKGKKRRKINFIMVWLEIIFKEKFTIEGLKKLKENDLILISDLDEIPNSSEIKFSKIKNNITFLNKKCFIINLILYYKDYTLVRNKSCKKKNLIFTSMVKKYKR